METTREKQRAGRKLKSRGVIRQKKKRAARRIRRTDQWEHLRKRLFRYKDSARHAYLAATGGEQ